MAQLLAPGSILAMTDQAADRLIKLDSGDAALLYLHLLRRGSPEGLRWPEERKRAALKQLQDQGLASLSLTAAPAEPEEPPEAPPPEYALEDINAALGDRSSAFPALADEVERRLGSEVMYSTHFAISSTLPLPTLPLIMDSIFFTFRYFLKNRHRLQIQFFIGRQKIESCLRVLLD